MIFMFVYLAADPSFYCAVSWNFYLVWLSDNLFLFIAYDTAFF
jgi:hypothetical protein